MGMRTSVQAFKFKCHVSGQGWTLIEMSNNTAHVLLPKFRIVAVLGTDPALPSEKDLANKLETTQDIQGFVSCVRKLFIKLSGKKKFSRKSRMCSSWFDILQLRERRRASASGKFYETKKRGRNVSSFSQNSEILHCVKQSSTFIFLYVVKSHVLNLGCSENKLVETLKLFPWISPVVYTVIDLMFIGPCIIAIVDEWKSNLMSLAILFHLLCARHVSDINISFFRSLRLCWWITTSVILFWVRCVWELLLRLVFGGVRFAGFSLQNEHHQIPTATNAPTHNELRTRPMW